MISWRTWTGWDLGGVPAVWVAAPVGEDTGCEGTLDGLAGEVLSVVERPGARAAVAAGRFEGGVCCLARQASTPMKARKRSSRATAAGNQRSTKGLAAAEEAGRTGGLVGRLWTRGG